MENAKKPAVGVGVMVKKDNKVLFLKRQDVHGAGAWSFPGGHVELFESLEETAKRETVEETGIHIKNIKMLGIGKDLFEQEGKHYFTIILSAEWDSGEAENLEPEKAELIGWFDWKKPPQPLIFAARHLKEGTYFPKKKLL